MTRIRIRQFSPRELLVIGLPALVLIGASFWVASRFIKPAPPDHIVISTGAEGGAYYAHAERYAEILARDGVTLEVRESAGAVENLAHLADPGSDVELGFTQGGLPPPAANDDDAREIQKLATIGFEPLWVFIRQGPPIDHLTQLRGLRLAVGPEGSGTRALVMELLSANGLDRAPTRLLPLGTAEGAEALGRGRIDALFIVAAAEAPSARALLRRTDIQLVNLATAEAYTRRFPHLTQLKLPQGSIDFVKDLPPRDISLVATTANLVAADTAHPALVYLVLKAASEVHKKPGIFQRPGEFPAAREGDFEYSEEASRYFSQGLPFLQRVFPYWIANLIERLWVLILPIIAVVIPLLRIVPPLYSWQVQSRFFRRYGELRYLETEIDRAEDPDALERILERLDKLESEARALRVPLAYSNFLYEFRTHLELVRSKLRARLSAPPVPA